VASRRDAEATAAPPNAALQDVARVKLPADLPDIDRLALVLEGRIARDDNELGEPRQLGCDVLGHAIAEIVLLRVAAEIGERQHRDGGPIKHRRLGSSAGIEPGRRPFPRMLGRVG
jgi:hypothetical protein